VEFEPCLDHLTFSMALLPRKLCEEQFSSQLFFILKSLLSIWSAKGELFVGDVTINSALACGSDLPDGRLHDNESRCQGHRRCLQAQYDYSQSWGCLHKQKLWSKAILAGKFVLRMKPSIWVNSENCNLSNPYANTTGIDHIRWLYPSWHVDHSCHKCRVRELS